jgi:hypothetical protein
MLKQIIALGLCASLLTGCASAGLRASAVQPDAVRQAQSDTRVIADYVQKLPAGSTVKVEMTNGKSIKGTLMSATETSIVVQRNTRIPEEPVTIALPDVARVTLETGHGNPGRAIAIGAAAGAGAAVGAILILAALLAGD